VILAECLWFILKPSFARILSSNLITFSSFQKPQMIKPPKEISKSVKRILESVILNSSKMLSENLINKGVLQKRTNVLFAMVLL